MSEPKIVFVVAIADNGVIGHDGAMPWRLKSDLQRFKAITLNKPVIMGRKTFISIGRPLPGRTNIVVTRDRDFHAPQIVTASSLEAAREIARGDALRRGASEIAVIGGAEIFRQWMDIAERLDITEVHATPQGDCFLDKPDLKQWREVARADHKATAADSSDFSFTTYMRV